MARWFFERGLGIPAGVCISYLSEGSIFIPVRGTTGRRKKVDWSGELFSVCATEMNVHACTWAHTHTHTHLYTQYYTQKPAVSMGIPKAVMKSCQQFTTSWLLARIPNRTIRINWNRPDWLVCMNFHQSSPAMWAEVNSWIGSNGCWSRGENVNGVQFWSQVGQMPESSCQHPSLVHGLSLCCYGPGLEVPAESLGLRSVLLSLQMRCGCGLCL